MNTPFPIWRWKEIGEVVAIEPIGNNKFRNIVAQRNTGGQLFGGQCVGLALNAACRTVPERSLHAAHGYFLRAGSVERPVECHVEHIFEGRSFSNRLVHLMQDDEVIFTLQASFQRQEDGAEHAEAPPAAPAPETLPSIQELLPEWRGKVPSGIFERLGVGRVIDLRPIDAEAYISGKSGEKRIAWVRTPSAALLDGAGEHCAILAYLTDYWLAETAIQRHQTNETKLRMASLNQAMWFHRPFRVDDWLLVVCDSPAAQNGRGLGRSHIFDSRGRLVSHALQEVLFRICE
ncbi:MAG: thioesterase family protein [Sphingobium sp.]|nr:thioesterase family protein [Sphingobium sp.]